GTGAWLWRFVPFTLKTAAGSPIILFFLHRLLPHRIPVRRRPGGPAANANGWRLSPRFWVRAKVRQLCRHRHAGGLGAPALARWCWLVVSLVVSAPCGPVARRGCGLAPVPGEARSVGQRPGEPEDGQRAVIEAGHGADLAAGEGEHEGP